MKKSKSGAVIGAENVASLKSYIEALIAEGRRLPRRGGGVNASAIALACGFDRGVLYNNPAAARLLKAAIERESETVVEVEEEAVSAPKTDRRDQRILALEQQNASLRAENAGLRERLRRLEQVEDIMVGGGRRVSS